jgi:hypothetical protein
MLRVKDTAEMGFRESQCGTRMFRCAVNYVAGKSENENVKLGCDVYPHVAEEFHTTVCCVEKAIRTAIRTAEFTVTPKNLILLTADAVRSGVYDKGE